MITTSPNLRYRISVLSLIGNPPNIAKCQCLLQNDDEPLFCLLYRKKKYRVLTFWFLHDFSMEINKRIASFLEARKSSCHNQFRFTKNVLKKKNVSQIFSTIRCRNLRLPLFEDYEYRLKGDLALRRW